MKKMGEEEEEEKKDEAGRRTREEEEGMRRRGLELFQPLLFRRRLSVAVMALACQNSGKIRVLAWPEDERPLSLTERGLVIFREHLCDGRPLHCYAQRARPCDNRRDVTVMRC